MKVAILLGTLLAVASASTTYHSALFGGSLAFSDELIYNEQASFDHVCGQLGFTQSLFGESAIDQYIDGKNGIVNVLRAGPVNLPDSLPLLIGYKLIFARYNAVIYAPLSASSNAVPSLRQQVDQFLAYDFNILNTPDFISITLGPNDIGAISVAYGQALVASGGNSTVAGLTANNLITAVVNELVSVVSVLHSTFPHAKILVSNSPSIADTPAYNAQPASTKLLLDSLTVSYNSAIASPLAHVGATVWDAFGFLKARVASSVAPYNTTACSSLCEANNSCVYADTFSASAYTSKLASASIKALLG